MFKVGVLTGRKDEAITEGISKLYPGLEIEFTGDQKRLKSMIEKDEIFELVIDFDVANKSQVKFVEWLNNSEDKGIKYSFWSDLKWKLEQQKKREVVSPLDNDKVDELVKSLLPIRDKVSNKFLAIPSLSVTNLDFVQFSHHDGESLYFISSKSLEAKDLPLKMSLTSESEEPKLISCNGELEETEQDGQDEDEKFYYKLVLDNISAVAMKEFFTSCETVNEFVSNWAQMSKDDEE